MQKSLNRSQGFILNDLKLFQRQQEALMLMSIWLFVRSQKFRIRLNITNSFILNIRC